MGGLPAMPVIAVGFIGIENWHWGPCTASIGHARGAAIRAGDRAAGPSGLPAPIHEQANRGFEPPVFLQGFLAAAQQSQALRYTGDKDEELLGEQFRIA